MATMRECAVCPATTDLKTCGRCKDALYCSTEHAKLLWPLHKKYCGTGTEIWYEEDLTKIELEKLAKIGDEEELPGAGSLNEWVAPYVPEGTSRAAIWSSTSAAIWRGDDLTRSWIISNGRDVLLEENPAGVNGAFNAQLTIKTPVTQRMATYRCRTWFPGWRFTPSDHDVRNSFLYRSAVLHFLGAVSTHPSAKAQAHDLLGNATRRLVVASTVEGAHPKMKGEMQSLVGPLINRARTLRQQATQ